MTDPSARTIGQTLAIARVDHLSQAEIDALLRDLRDHVVEHGGEAKGAVTIKLEFNVSRDAIATKASVRAARPSAPAMKGLAYMTEDGRLTTRDPAQPDLPRIDAPSAGYVIADAD